MMSYKYKDEILADIGPEPNCNYDFEKEEYYKKIDELNHVYAQASKADEYEAKAKAFDAICKAHEPLERRMSPVTVDEGLDFAEETEKIILKFYESGESND